MGDLPQWLGEQLAEDERIAREALRYVDAHWRRDDEENVTLASGMTAAGEQAVAITADRWRRPMIESPGVVAHVAEHDPARVLREIAAKRRILGTLVEEGGDRMFADIFRMFALPYADRPGYRQEWSP